MKLYILYILLLSTFSSFSQSKKEQIKTLETQLEQQNKHLLLLDSILHITSDRSAEYLKQIRLLQAENELLRKIMKEYVIKIDSIQTRLYQYEPMPEIQNDFGPADQKHKWDDSQMMDPNDPNNPHKLKMMRLEEDEE